MTKQSDDLDEALTSQMVNLGSETQREAVKEMSGLEGAYSLSRFEVPAFTLSATVMEASWPYLMDAGPFGASLARARHRYSGGYISTQSSWLTPSDQANLQRAHDKAAKVSAGDGLDIYRRAEYAVIVKHIRESVLRREYTINRASDGREYYVAVIADGQIMVLDTGKRGQVWVRDAIRNAWSPYMWVDLRLEVDVAPAREPSPEALARVADIPDGVVLHVDVWINPASKFSAIKDALPPLPPDAAITQFLHSGGAKLTYTAIIDADSRHTLALVYDITRGAGLGDVFTVRYEGEPAAD